jgi:hypothetical protein
MVKRAVVGVLQKCSRSGGDLVVGYIEAETTPPEGTRTLPDLEVLDPEDGSNTAWILAFPVPVPLLSEQDMTDILAGEAARRAKAKLTDADLDALGLTRD